MAKPDLPAGMHTIQPYLVCNEAAAAIKFYEQALGATERSRMNMPGTETVMHAEMAFGDSVFMLSEENPQWHTRSPRTLGGTPVSMMCYVPDVDAAHKQAIAAGGKDKMQPANMFWGDRMAAFEDPFGHAWTLATHVEDVSPADMQKGVAEMFSKGGNC